MSFNPVTRAVTIATRTIPKQILSKVFTPTNLQWHSATLNLDEEIARQVIRPRVLVDCDISGGHEHVIRMRDCEVTRTEDLQTVIFVPKKATEGRSITQVLSISLMDPRISAAFGNAPGYAPCSVNPITAATANLSASYEMPATVSTARVELIAENTILVKESFVGIATGSVRCMLANDANLSNLKMRFYHAFVQLCMFAVKSHIWNEMIVSMDEGEVKFGSKLGAFRNIVETYADAETQYQDYLENRWAKVAFMNDTETYHNFIRSSFGNGH